MASALASMGKKIKINNTIRFIFVFFVSFVINIFAVEYLLVKCTHKHNRCFFINSRLQSYDIFSYVVSFTYGKYLHEEKLENTENQAIN